MGKSPLEQKPGHITLPNTAAPPAVSTAEAMVCDTGNVGAIDSGDGIKLDLLGLEGLDVQLDDTDETEEPADIAAYDLGEVDFLSKQELYQEALNLALHSEDKHPENPELTRRITQTNQSIEPNPAPNLSPEITPIQASQVNFEEVLSAQAAKLFSPLATGELPPLLVASEFEDLRQYSPADIPAGDYRSHYDLGIAYQEMGMFNEAIDEFELASTSTSLRIATLITMGQCLIQLDRTGEAVARFHQALQTPGLLPEQQSPIHYELGEAYARLEAWEDAYKYFKRVEEVLGNFRKTHHWLAKIQPKETELATE
ncbi:MAG: tetratricopeptide repeat protein [Myxococcota bacterium]|nr:tetratricopeptide repeat protein [Myxococcota bacterium]